ncbi:hypothetical Protein YC6258_01665 [Gynuella sunshinyii YC6258]|uniref:Uncharacterized protein n=1 Tax=Gynuella sunshinyii YC6258 TaxID=1445510 RepID=A0A0C5VK19_9GAMM|nr:hypothetical Protein YC6258_01665 [Gynuella sunshinyii YC6258]
MINSAAFAPVIVITEAYFVMTIFLSGSINNPRVLPSLPYSACLREN